MAPLAKRPVILITGCSSGIGAALAELLYAQDKYRVVITAREKSLSVLQQKFRETESFWIQPLDVTKPSERQRLVRNIQMRWGTVDILVNNAGVSYRAVVEHMTEQDEQTQMDTNYFGPLGLIRLVLPSMRAHRRGRIINVSSVSGMMAMPTMAAYTASKHALEGASEALWYETKPFGVHVVLIQPGFIHSASFEHVLYTEQSKPEKSATSAYAEYYSHMTPFVAKMMSLARATPQSVAQRILRSIEHPNPPLWVPVTMDARFFFYLRRWLPRRFLLPFLFMCLPNARHWVVAARRRRTLAGARL